MAYAIKRDMNELVELIRVINRGGAMMTQIGKVVPFWMFFFLASCGPATLDDLRVEGEAQTRMLAEELRKIESKEDLQKAVPLLRKRFNKIADLLIEAKRFSCQETEGSLASEHLFAELARLYEMPGGREAIEMAQTGAVQKLQADF